jgi:hypothetical protein
VPFGIAAELTAAVSLSCCSKNGSARSLSRSAAVMGVLPLAQRTGDTRDLFALRSARSVSPALPDVRAR